MNNLTDWKVVAFYRFTPVRDLAARQAAVDGFCRARQICGTILLAPEGINGTVAGSEQAVKETIDFLDTKFGLRQGEVKFSAAAAAPPFKRLKIRIKKEIITMQAPEADPSKEVGTYVAAADWNDIIADPETLVIDTRNQYEVASGSFAGAIDPGIETFTQFKDFVAQKLDPARHKKIAMYCTGGIRCEKASAYLLAHGFAEVYHLKGGILQYLENVPAAASQWRGSCFVFDERDALGHALKQVSR